MRLNVSTSIETAACEIAGDDLLFLGFHGFSNDENEMIRIIDAIYDVPKQDASSTDNSIAPAQHPNYLSFRGTYERPYIGSYYWYPDGCSVEERRRECSAVGDAVVRLLDSPAYAHFRKVLIGFSQGGYLSYRMVAEHPDAFDRAILMSPSNSFSPPRIVIDTNSPAHAESSPHVRRTLDINRESDIHAVAGTPQTPISIHALRKESDPGTLRLTKRSKNFNPHSPCGERPQK